VGGAAVRHATSVNGGRTSPWQTRRGEARRRGRARCSAGADGGRSDSSDVMRSCSS
jgi:hypothetical protein